MPRLKASNNFSSMLAQNISAEDTEFVVADASGAPEVPFRLTIGVGMGEIVEVGEVDGNAFKQVIRGLEDTEAVEHLSGDPVEARWTAGMYGELTSMDEVPLEAIQQHISDTDIHVSIQEKEGWDSKAEGSHTHLAEDVNGLEEHLADDTAHVTQEDRDYWDAKAEGTHSHETSDVSGLDEHLSDDVAHVSQEDRDAWDSKAEGVHEHETSDISGLDEHLSDDVVHVSQEDRDSWDSKAEGAHEHEIADVSDLQNALDAKETPVGAQSKADGALSAAKAYTDEQTASLESTTNKGKADGYAPLDSDVKVPDANLPETAIRWPGWSEVTNKPSEFTPESHTHGAEDVTGLAEHLEDSTIHVTQEDRDSWDSKAEGEHGHDIKDITDLQDTLDAKETPAGAQDKADGALSSAKTYTDTKTSTMESTTNKGQANGYAALDNNAKVPLAQLPDAAKQGIYVVEDSTEREALSGLISGDKAYEVDTGDSYIWDGNKWLVASKADWENVNLDWNNITNPPATATRWPKWEETTDKPAKFTPEDHTHSSGDVEGLDDHLNDGDIHVTTGDKSKWDGKADAAHGHETSDIVGLDEHLSDDVIHVTQEDRNSWDSKAAGNHGHSISDITNLQTTLNAKQSTSGKGTANGYAGLDSNARLPSQNLTVHGHPISDVTGLQDALDSKNPRRGAKTVSDELYTLVLGDAEQILSVSSSVIEIPKDASVNFPIGTHIRVRQVGDRVVRFLASGDVELQSVGNKLALSADEYSLVTLVKIAEYTWFLYGDLVEADDAFVLIVDTTRPIAGNTGNTVAAITPVGTVNIQVDWGDGTIEEYTTEGPHTHTYAEPGIYTVEITGSMPGYMNYGVGANADAQKVIAVASWGDVGLTNLSWAFSGCRYLKLLPRDNTKENLSSVTTTSQMFRTCSSLAYPPLFNTSSLTNMSAMFVQCVTLREVPLFDTKNVTNFSAAFNMCNNLAIIAPLDTSSVTNFNSVFANTSKIKSAPFQGTKVSINYSPCKAMQREDIVDVFNGLADMTGSSSPSITISGISAVSDLTQDDLDIALDKNWTVVN